MDSSATWLQTIGTLAAAVAAFLSWRASRASNQTGKGLAEIERERERQHRELSPEFSSSLAPLNLLSDDGHLRLIIDFKAPPGLEELSSLTATIRNDRPDRDVLGQPREGLTQQDVSNQIWGPARFAAGPTGSTKANFGRSISVDHRLQVGEAFMFELEWTRAPHWYAGFAPLHMWIQDMPGPIILVIEARHTDFERPWRIPVVIELDEQLKDARRRWMNREEPESQINVTPT